MVIATHLQAGLFRHPWKYNWMNLGGHGVTIFFALSGFLITSRVLASSAFSLRDFYRRRFFRLAPAAVVYLLAIVLVGMVLRIHLIGSDMWACLLLFRNYVAENSANAMTSHFWSLSIEEQFYIAWPAVLLFAGRRRSLWIAIAGACGLALWRVEHWSYYLTHGLHSEARLDALMTGCALALILERPSIRELFIQHNRALLAAALAVLLYAIWRYQILMPLYESVAIATLLGCTSLAPRSAIGQLLEMKPVRAIGAMSYSLYLWQEFFLIPHWRLLTPAMIVMLFVTAYMSYRLVEPPGIEYARRRAARREQDQAVVFVPN